HVPFLAPRLALSGLGGRALELASLAPAVLAAPGLAFGQRLLGASRGKSRRDLTRARLARNGRGSALRRNRLQLAWNALRSLRRHLRSQLGRQLSWQLSRQLGWQLSYELSRQLRRQPAGDTRDGLLHDRRRALGRGLPSDRGALSLGAAAGGDPGSKLRTATALRVSLRGRLSRWLLRPDRPAARLGGLAQRSPGRMRLRPATRL